ncbi:MAG: hypothetical protein AB8B73_00050 [Ekhidna sp.]
MSDSVTQKEHSLVVERSKEPLVLTASSDSVSKTVSINSRNSFLYYLNFIPNSPFLIGNAVFLLVDNTRPYKNTYPRKIYIDMSRDGSDFTTHKPLDKRYADRKNIIKIDALKFASFEAGGVEISFEKKKSDKFSTQLKAGYILPSISQFQTFKPRRIRGFQLGIEERMYLKERAPDGYYFAGEFSYLNSKYNYTDTFEWTNKYYTIFFDDDFLVKKQTFSLNAKFGKQIFIKRLSIDLSAGAGLRFKNVKHRNLINPDAELSTSTFLFRDVEATNNTPGKYITISIPISVKFGWLF